MPKTEILGIHFDTVTLAEAVEQVAALAVQRQARMVVTPNAEIGWCALHDKALRDAVNGADFISPDGAGVVLAARILGTPLKERVAGFDLFTALLSVMETKGLTLFLLGAAPGVAERAAQAMRRQHPGLRIVGMHDGYFQDDTEIEPLLDAASPNVIVVALGSPKQEFWMMRHRGRPGWGAMMGLGGTLDIFAGEDRRAPAFFIRLNLEWLYRLLRHPGRIGRMMRLPAYILRAAGRRLFGR